MIGAVVQVGNRHIKQETLNNGVDFLTIPEFQFWFITFTLGALPHSHPSPLNSLQVWYGQNTDLIKQTKDLLARGVSEDRLLTDTEVSEQHRLLLFMEQEHVVCI